jgi:hypothetical protein
MTRHPLRTVLEDLDYQPAPGFREALRAQLVADLATTGATQSGPHLDASDDADEPQEITVLQKIDRSRSVPPRTRVLIAIAAAVIVAVGVTAVIVNHRSSTTSSVDNGADLAIAGAGLISVDQLGPGWSPEFDVDPSWPDLQESYYAQPECAEYTAAVHPLKATAAGAITSLVNLQHQIITEELTIYPSKDVASRVMDAVASPGFQDCFFAAWDAASEVGFPGDGASTSAFNIAPPAAHGDRQVDFGMETLTSIDSRTRLYHNVWIQVDRSIIIVTVSPDGLGSDNPAGNMEKAIAAALASLNEAMPAG